MSSLTTSYRLGAGKPCGTTAKRRRPDKATVRRKIKNLQTGVELDGDYDTLTNRLTPDGATTGIIVRFDEWAISRLRGKLPTERGVYAMSLLADTPEVSDIYRLTASGWNDAKGDFLTDAGLDWLQQYNDTHGLIRLIAEPKTKEA